MRPIPLRPAPEILHREQRRSFCRGLAAVALAGRERMPADRFVKAHWPDDLDAGRITRAATSPTGTGDFPVSSAAALMSLVAPSSAAAKLFARAVSIDLSGLSIVSLTYPDVTPLPAFVGEGQPAAVGQLLFTGTQLGPVRKLMLITGLSNELESVTAETASTIIGRSLDMSASLAVDGAAFATTAGDATKPPGLLYGATPIVATAGGGLNALVADISALAGALATAGFGDEPVLVVNPAQATRMRLLASPNFTNPVFPSVAVPDKTVIAIAPSGVAVGYSGATEIERARDAVIHWSDSPAPIVDGTPATPVRSGYQEDILSLRLRAWCCWAALPGASQFTINTTW